MSSSSSSSSSSLTPVTVFEYTISGSNPFVCCECKCPVANSSSSIRMTFTQQVGQPIQFQLVHVEACMETLRLQRAIRVLQQVAIPARHHRPHSAQETLAVTEEIKQRHPSLYGFVECLSNRVAISTEAAWIETYTMSLPSFQMFLPHATLAPIPHNVMSRALFRGLFSHRYIIPFEARHCDSNRPFSPPVVMEALAKRLKDMERKTSLTCDIDLCLLLTRIDLTAVYGQIFVYIRLNEALTDLYYELFHSDLALVFHDLQQPQQHYRRRGVESWLKVQEELHRRITDDLARIDTYLASHSNTERGFDYTALDHEPPHALVRVNVTADDRLWITSNWQAVARNAQFYMWDDERKEAGIFRRLQQHGHSSNVDIQCMPFLLDNFTSPSFAHELNTHTFERVPVSANRALWSYRHINKAKPPTPTTATSTAAAKKK